MANVYNRSAFHSVAANTTSPALIRAYCGMVVVELALKDHLGIANLGHDLPEMLRRLGNNNGGLRAALNQHRCDLTNKLAALHSSKIDGSVGRVSAQSYPNIRYLRHTSDWPINASTDSDIEALRVCIDRIRAFLKSNARLANPI